MSAIDLNSTSGSTKHQHGDGGRDSSQVKAKLSEISKSLSQLQEQNEQSYLEQGRLLLEAKSLFGKHGEWLDWLKNNSPFSVRQAQRLTRVAEWVGKTTPGSFLDFSKAYALTRIPRARMNDFLTQIKTTKTDEDPLHAIQAMGKRELETVIREYLLSPNSGPRTHKEEKTKANSAAMSSEDHALDTLCHLEVTIANLVESVVNQKVGDEAYDTLISEIRRLCEDTLGKLPSDDVEPE